jgi:hypothetical protein
MIVSELEPIGAVYRYRVEYEWIPPRHRSPASQLIRALAPDGHQPVDIEKRTAIATVERFSLAALQVTIYAPEPILWSEFGPMAKAVREAHERAHGRPLRWTRHRLESWSALPRWLEKR